MKLYDLKRSQGAMSSFRKVEKMLLISVSSFCKLSGLKEILNRGRNSDSCKSLPVGFLHRGRNESWGVGQGEYRSHILPAEDTVEDVHTDHMSFLLFQVAKCHENKLKHFKQFPHITLLLLWLPQVTFCDHRLNTLVSFKRKRRQWGLIKKTKVEALVCTCGWTAGFFSTEPIV